MRRRWAIIAAVLVAALLVSVPLSAGDLIHLVINGSEMYPDVPPQLVGGRVLVPIRFISEAFGFQVHWDQAMQTAMVWSSGPMPPIPPGTPGAARLVVEGAEVKSDVPPQIVNGRLMVPIRVVSEAFGFQVSWLQGYRTATVAEQGALGLMEVHFIDVGQADSILVELPDGKTILIDGGDDAAVGTILAFLASQGVTQLDFVVATHPHADHIGGLDDVIAAVPLGAIILPDKSHTTQAYANLMAAIESRGVEPTWAQPETLLVEDGPIQIRVLGPMKTTYDDLNDCSVVLKVTYGETDLLFVGDAEAKAERDLIGSGQDLGAEVLKVGHHGSSSSSTPEFLAAVSPDYAVISVGAGNTYGHPASTTLSALASAGAKIYRTDAQGTISAIGTRTSVIFALSPWTGSVSGGTSTTPAPSPGGSSSVTVYITATGSKYHAAGCRYLSQSSIPISLDEAKARGYTACSVCNPPR
jgi:competence protein ComEC